MNIISFPEGLKNITLRDYLAANERSLPGESWLQRSCHGQPLTELPFAKQAALLADYRYYMADAMLSARSRLHEKPKVEKHKHAVI